MVSLVLGLPGNNEEPSGLRINGLDYSGALITYLKLALLCGWLSLVDSIRVIGLLYLALTLPPHALCVGRLGKIITTCFFNALFSSKIWAAILGKCNVNWTCNSWNDWVGVVARDCKGKSLSTIIKKLGFCCTFYQIWMERNNRVFNKERKPEEVVLQSIICMVRCRCLALKNIKNSPTDDWFQQEWRLPATILKLSGV